MEIELIIAGVLLLLSFWILWKTRKIIWFLFLFLLAFIILCGIKFGWDEFINQNEEVGIFIIIIGAAFTAIKFAKKRSL